VIDADRATVETDPLFAMGTHVIFSGECLRNTVGTDDLAAGLARMAQFTDAFLAVSNGALPVLWRENQAIREMPVFPVAALDTRRRRRVPRRLHPRARGGMRDRAGDAVRGRDGRNQVHAVRRQHRCAAPRRGRGTAGGVGESLTLRMALAEKPVAWWLMHDLSRMERLDPAKGDIRAMDGNRAQRDFKDCACDGFAVGSLCMPLRGLLFGSSCPLSSYRLLARRHSRDRGLRIRRRVRNIR
jgi:hypothetical protein